VGINIKGYKPTAHPMPYDTNVKWTLFDGYQQVVKEKETKPTIT
jgi:hypothetical protein